MSQQIKGILRPLYRHSKVLKSLVRAMRLPGYIKAAKTEVPLFNGDSILHQSVDWILMECGVTHFVETGTYLGHTCRYIASKYPALRIITIEINEDFFKAGQTTLSQFKNVTQILGDSAEMLRCLLQLGEIKGLPLFYLDAHWYSYLPLPDEIQSIGKYLSDAVMLIHDFQVPGREDYGFDVCNGRAIGMEMLREGIAVGKPYELFLPKYFYHDVYQTVPENGQKLRGYALVFQGAREAIAKFSQNTCAMHYIRQAL